VSGLESGRAINARPVTSNQQQRPGAGFNIFNKNQMKKLTQR